MKVHTNLTQEELNLVAKGLQALAKQETSDGKYEPENEAEKELVTKAETAFKEMLVSLKREIGRLE